MSVVPKSNCPASASKGSSDRSRVDAPCSSRASVSAKSSKSSSTDLSLRSASVIAEEECSVYVLLYEDLRKMERDEPAVANAFHRFVAKLLADRVADSNRLIEALMR